MYTHLEAEATRLRGEVDEAARLAAHCEAMWKDAERETAVLRAEKGLGWGGAALERRGGSSRGSESGRWVYFSQVAMRSLHGFHG